MKRILMAITLIAAIILCGCSKTAEQVLTYQDYYDMGIRYLSEGNYEEAIIAFTAAIEIDPKQAESYIGRGDAYVGLGNTEENLSAALADYEKALELDSNNSSVYLKIADIYIAREEYGSLADILEQAQDRFGETNEILERESVIEAAEEAQLLSMLTSNVWDTSWQTNEYHIFFPNQKGIRLMCIGMPGFLYDIEEFVYTIENNTIKKIAVDSLDNTEYEDDWNLSEDGKSFVNMIEEYGDIVEQIIDPVSPEKFFTEMAILPDNGVISESYWTDLLDLLTLYMENSSPETEAAVFRQEQEEWQEKLNQEIADQGININTPSGAAWMQYYVKNRICDILDLPIENTEPPIYTPLLSKEEAMQIALDFWAITQGEIAEETGYEMYVTSRDNVEIVEKEGRTYYFFILEWIVEGSNGEKHPSTLDFLYVDAQTGECHQDAPVWQLN